MSIISANNISYINEDGQFTLPPFTPRQSLAFRSPATEVLFGGAAGAGKSHLMRCIALIYAIACPGLQIYLFRRMFSDLYSNHVDGPTGFRAMISPLEASGFCKFIESVHEIRFTNGSCIHLRHMQFAKDIERYRGAEIHVLLFDELTSFTEKMYRFLRQRCRMTNTFRNSLPKEFRNKLPLIFSGSNPGDIGHNWVKRTFRPGKEDVALWGKIIKQSSDEGGMLRQFIPGRVTDNPHLNAEEYIARIEGLGDKALVAGMRDGDWDVVAGGALDDLWLEHKLVIPRTKIDDEISGFLRFFRVLDYGSYDPFAYVLMAECLEECRIGSKQLLVGDYVAVDEIYGAAQGKAETHYESNDGLRLTPSQLADRILELEYVDRDHGWLPERAVIEPGPADSRIYAHNNGTPDPDATGVQQSASIAEQLQENGVTFVAAYKGMGSRVNGLHALRQRLLNALQGKSGAIYFMANCKAAISHLPTIPRSDSNPEDATEKGMSTHMYDVIRYAVYQQTERFAANLRGGY